MALFQRLLYIDTKTKERGSVLKECFNYLCPSPTYLYVVTVGNKMHIGRREGNALLPGAGPRGQQHFALDAGVGGGGWGLGV